MSRKKLGLSIRGGGAQGAAYLGALDAFKEAGIEIDMLIGSSAGAIASAFYAAGIDSKSVLATEKDLHLWSFFGLDSLKDKSVMSDDKLIEFARTFVGHKKIQDLSCRLFIQLTQVSTGKEVVMQEGDLATAIIASSSMPPLMNVIKIDGENYIDGGYSAGYNAKFLRDRGADVVVGLTIDSNDMFNKKNLTTIDFIYMIVKNLHDIDLKLNPVDFLIDGLGDTSFNLLDFQKSISLYDKGKRITQQKIPEIKKLL